MERNRSQDFPKSRKALKAIMREALTVNSCVLYVPVPEWCVPMNHYPAV